MGFLMPSPIRILAQGYTEQISAFKNIDSDIPFIEKMDEDKNCGYHVGQDSYNSAEMYNNELRKKCASPLPCYDLQEIPEVYRTKRFKVFKFSQIVSVSEYLIRVSTAAENIAGEFIRICKEAQARTSAEHLKSEEQREFTRVRFMISSLFSLFAEMIFSFSDLQADRNSIGVEKVTTSMKESLRLSLAVRQVPCEIRAEVETVFPHIDARYADWDNCRGGRNDCSATYADFTEVEKRFYQILIVAVRNLMNQFSYYITPDAFLNNPLGRTIFVVPISMYRKFNFQSGGLFRSEIIDYAGFSQESMAKRYREFLLSVSESFAALRDEAKSALTDAKRLENDFGINEFLVLYHKKHPLERTDKICRFAESPAVAEKLTEMLFKVRSNMVTKAQAGKDPWFEDGMCNQKETDNDMVYFLLTLYERYPDALARFPQAQMLRLFNIFSYSCQQVKCMNRHVKNFHNASYKTSENYEQIFGAILKR